MKKIIYVFLVSFVISMIYYACTVEPVQATVTTANLQSKGGPNKPQYITLEEAQVLIDEAVKAAVDQVYIHDFGSEMGNMEYRNIFYGRRQTAPSSEGIYFLEELNDRDWEIDIAGAGGFTSIWLDGNGGDSDNNITLSTDGRGTFSKYWQTQNWIMFTQYKGIYNFQYLRTFNTNDEAKAYFSSAGFSRVGSIYKTPDGTLKVTY